MSFSSWAEGVTGSAGSAAPENKQGLPRHSGRVRKGIYCVGEEFPVQRTVTTPEQHPEGTLHMQPGSEPRNCCQGQQLLLETWEKLQPTINAGIYRYYSKTVALGRLKCVNTINSHSRVLELS